MLLVLEGVGPPGASGGPEPARGEQPVGQQQRGAGDEPQQQQRGAAAQQTLPGRRGRRQRADREHGQACRRRGRASAAPGARHARRARPAGTGSHIRRSAPRARAARATSPPTSGPPIRLCSRCGTAPMLPSRAPTAVISSRCCSTWGGDQHLAVHVERTAGEQHQHHRGGHQAEALPAGAAGRRGPPPHQHHHAGQRHAEGIRPPGGEHRQQLRGGRQRIPGEHPCGAGGRDPHLRRGRGGAHGRGQRHREAPIRASSSRARRR